MQVAPPVRFWTLKKKEDLRMSIRGQQTGILSSEPCALRRRRKRRRGRRREAGFNQEMIGFSDEPLKMS